MERYPLTWADPYPANLRAWGYRWWRYPLFSFLHRLLFSHVGKGINTPGSCSTCWFFQPEIALPDNLDWELGVGRDLIVTDTLEGGGPWLVQGACLYFYPYVITDLLSLDKCPYHEFKSPTLQFVDDIIKDDDNADLRGNEIDLKIVMI